MNDALLKMTERARQDDLFRSALLKTRESSEPMIAFCEFASEQGYPITVGELLTMGEEYSCNQLKSTNGGGVTPTPYFDDAYEMFFAGIE